MAHATPLLICVCLWATVSAAPVLFPYYDPANNFQIHLSLTENDPTQMIVTWSTPFPLSEGQTVVIYDLATKFPRLSQKSLGFQTQFVDNGTLHHTQYIQRATMTNLIPGSRYMYRVHVGDADEWSSPFAFNAVRAGSFPTRFTVFGDFGLENAVSLPSLIAEVGTSDAVVHVGDFAYDMWRDNATWGDQWFNLVQPIAATQPYMVNVGNHEGMYDFLNYRNRFTMPMWKETENLYFSWNLGLAHWIAYATEFYFVYEAMDGHGGVHRNFGPYPELAKAQLAFIEADLIKANQNRHNVPWLIAYGHRPMYCSDNDDDDCVKMRDQWRFELEDLFYRYGVDYVIEAHQHSYERLWPTYNGTVYNGTSEPYTEPVAPVHIVSGSAGCNENLDTFGPPMGPWSAVRVSDYGYGHLTFFNTTHSMWEQINAINGSLVDEIFVIKKHSTPVWLR